ncbi:TetR family transcriptional regulator [Iodidimonas gelatinilytica]|uniref:TetR family transcriptional regulator n=1 Tax=Iodidimonas gelatinilytica TaxID=1236966 RepID=A0A5A7MS81_9PROT|nr:TetR/AcrR family transcriptional regulator [Iodidimonas gelatinilytica]GEQ98872.1 TetR family transcriptional regulator [Iodidimonas gelatinilytica]GER01667.1 TetR family transcriptional regulator [Iodidimonas gelatinilytica]
MAVGVTAQKIMVLAESYICERGFNAFSFRHLAEAVGVRTAGVHYHFRTKEELGAAVARDYRERFLEELPDPADPSIEPEQMITDYVSAFRDTLEKKNRVCLFGMLAAEIESLPPEVVNETRRFFELNVAWLEKVYARMKENSGTPYNPHAEALSLIARVEGLMIVARAMNDTSLFDQVFSSANGNGILCAKNPADQTHT